MITKYSKSGFSKVRINSLLSCDKTHREGKGEGGLLQSPRAMGGLFVIVFEEPAHAKGYERTASTQTSFFWCKFTRPSFEEVH